MGVLVLDDPALENRVEIVRAMDGQTLKPLLSEMSADRQAELFREMSERGADQAASGAPPQGRRKRLQLVLRYPPRAPAAS